MNFPKCPALSYFVLQHLVWVLVVCCSVFFHLFNLNFLSELMQNLQSKFSALTGQQILQLGLSQLTGIHTHTHIYTYMYLPYTHSCSFQSWRPHIFPLPLCISRLMQHFAAQSPMSPHINYSKLFAFNCMVWLTLLLLCSYCCC